MGSIVSPWTDSSQRETHERCSLVLISSINNVGGPLASLEVRTRGHGQAGQRDLSRVVVNVKKAGTRQDSG